MATDHRNNAAAPLNALCWASDFFALAAAYYGTLLLRFHSEWGTRMFSTLNRLLGVGPEGALTERLEQFYVIGAPRIILALAGTLGILYALHDLYPGRRFLVPRPVAKDVWAANITALLIFYAYWYLSRNAFHPRSFFLTLIVLNAGLGLLSRRLLSLGLHRLRHKRGWDTHNALLAGTGPEADAIAELIDAAHPHGIRTTVRRGCNTGAPFDQTLHDIEQSIARHRSDIVVLAEKNLPIGSIMRFLEWTDEKDFPCHVLSDKLDVLNRRARIATDRVFDSPLVYFAKPPQPMPGCRLQRILARLATALALLLLSPLLLLVALAIKLNSPGPALFVQERIGFNRTPFRIYKFRTMHADADQRQAEVETFNESAGALFKIRKDPRVTAVGRLLRRFSLDELPQLINVVRGEMALVGPRPLPRRDFESYYEDWHYGRHAGLPGLTCLWQVSGRSLVHFEDMCIMDIYYLRNHDWILDLKILLRTAQAVLFGQGAY